MEIGEKSNVCVAEKADSSLFISILLDVLNKIESEAYSVL